MKTSYPTVEHIVTSAKLCQLIYEFSDNAEATKQKIENLFFDSESELTWFNITATDTQAFIVKDKTNLYIVFQGSQSTADWITNAILELTPNPAGTGHYHLGFMHACTLSFKEIGTHIQSEVAKNPNLNVVITGHSLGGAMAMLYCFLLQTKTPQLSVKNLITFGQPRCGNLEFINFYNSLNIPYFRFVNDGDYVTDVPPPYGKSSWSHAGKGFLLNFNSVTPYNDNYEKNLMVRLFMLAITSLRMKFANKFNAKELAKNHDMRLYEKNILTNLPQIIEFTSAITTSEETPNSADDHNNTLS